MIEQTKQVATVESVGAHRSKSVPAMSLGDSPSSFGRSAAKPATFQEMLEAKSKASIESTGMPPLRTVLHGAAVPTSATGPLLAQSEAVSVQTDVRGVAGKTPKEVATQLLVQLPADSAVSLGGVKGSSVVLVTPAKGKVEREKKSPEIGKDGPETAKLKVGSGTNDAEMLPASKLINQEAELRSSPTTPSIVPSNTSRNETLNLAPISIAATTEATKEPIRKLANAVSTNMPASASLDIGATKRTGELEAAPHVEASTTLKEASATFGTNLSVKDHAGAQVAFVAGTTGTHAEPGRLQEVASSGNGTLVPTISRASAPIHSEQPEMKTLLATSNVLEIGVGDGTHGWLRVRAELGRTGEVTASVVAASVGAAEKLHRELPEMSAYLRSEQVGISSLVVHAVGKSSASQEQAMSMGAGTDARSSSQGNRERATNAGEKTASSDLSSSRPGVVDTESSFAFVGTTPMLNVDGSGGWLNVRV